MAFMTALLQKFNETSIVNIVIINHRFGTSFIYCDSLKLFLHSWSLLAASLSGNSIDTSDGAEYHNIDIAVVSFLCSFIVVSFNLH